MELGLPQHALLTLVRSLVITKLDRCNSVLVGTRYLHDRLQSVINVAARLVYSRRMSEHTTPLLRELHWLRVPERIQFRLCVLAYHCVHGTAPAYLADSLRLTSDLLLVAVCVRSTPRRCWCRQPVDQLWRPRVSWGCSAGVEQSATTDQGRLLATDI